MPLISLFAACHFSQVTTHEQPLKTDTVFVGTNNANSLPIDSSGDAEGIRYWQSQNCPRGIPAKSLNDVNPNIIKTHFSLKKEGAIERALLFNGDSLIIFNTGCDYLSLSYKLISNQKEVQFNAKTWYQKASDLLLGLQDSQVPFDFRYCSTLLAHEAQQTHPEFGKELLIGAPGTVKQSIWVDAPVTDSNKRSSITLKLFAGPL